MRFEIVMYSLTILLCLGIHSCNGLRILGLFPFHVRSHYTMCEALMRGLAARGHQVDVYSHFPLKQPVPNYKDFSLQGTLPGISNNMTFERATTSSSKEMIKYWLVTQGTTVCNLMEQPVFQKLFHDPPTDPPYDIIINEVKMDHLLVSITLYRN